MTASRFWCPTAHFSKIGDESDLFEQKRAIYDFCRRRLWILRPQGNPTLASSCRRARVNLKEAGPIAALSDFSDKGLLLTLSYWINMGEANQTQVTSDLRRMIMHQLTEDKIALSNIANPVGGTRPRALEDGGPAGTGIQTRLASSEIRSDLLPLQKME